MKRSPYILALMALLLGAISVNAQAYLTFTVNQPAALMALAGSDEIICPGDTATLGGNPAASGGTQAYSFLWTGSGLLNPAVSNAMAAPATTTSYVLTVTDAHNCTAVDTVTITVDTCVGSPDPQLPIELSVYPNPSTGKFKVVLDGSSDGAEMILNVTDMLGRTVSQRSIGQLNGRIETDFVLRQVARGTYFVRVQVGDQHFQRQIIIH